MTLNQTDFGNIYFKNPKDVFYPKSVDEFKKTISKLYQENKKITIRNTGHSVNGQTLTEDYQINLSLLKGIKFNEDKMEVTVHAGNTWAEVFEAIKFPKYALGVFPNNPGQKIQIGGTVSVGGIGPYSFKNGGLWDQIISIKLITPKGEEIECSHDKNSEYFKYSIAGFGKIGVISEITFKVVSSKEKIAILEILNFSDQKYFENIQHILGDERISGVSGISKGGSLMGLKPHALMLILESDNMEKDLEDVKNKLSSGYKIILKENEREYFDFNFLYTEINKKQIFNYYPIDLRRDHLQGIHPWSDYIFDFENYQKFLPILREVIKNYGLEKYILTQSFFDGKIAINIMPTYIGRHIGNDFPLVPEVVKVKNQYSYGIGFMPTIPITEIKKTLHAIKDLTNITYQLKGKRYLYGIHNLSQSDLESQFGKEVLNKWIKIKKETDPKNLLNPHVIFE